MRTIKAKLTPDQIQCLKSQIFSDNEPGTLLKDFSTLLDFIGATGIPVSGKNHLIAMKQLPELNQLMSKPLDVKLKRPQQKSFPHINGLYLLLRASGLTKIIVEKKETKLLLDNKMLTNWTSLNPIERYFALFYAWWYRGKAEIIGESGSDYRNSLHASLNCFLKNIGDGFNVKEKPNDATRFKFRPGLHNLALLELFGFIQIEQDSSLSVENWPIANIVPTLWGLALLNHFATHIAVFDEIDYGQPDDGLIELWTTELKTYLPALVNGLNQPEDKETRDGIYVFKVTLGSAYRKLAVPGTTSLDELANSILSAFKFDNDHLYEFVYKNRYGITERIVHPYAEDDDDLCTTDYVVGELALYQGMELVFHFDFGDDWRFQLVVDSIAGKDDICKAPTVIEKKGIPPEQYPDWDE